MFESFLNGRVLLHSGNCLDVLARLEECSIDSCVTDPPYHLTSIVKRFGGEDRKTWEAINGNHGGGVSPYSRTSVGFMGKQWDGGAIAFDAATWRAVYRVLKPGAHLIAMGGTRTYHRMACAIEDAGFEIRDTISWLYGSGFPKSHDVSKGIDRAAGAERDILGARIDSDGRSRRSEPHGGTSNGFSGALNVSPVVTAPATDAAKQWQGWGTALKPACELIVLARKPLSEGTVAANVLRWGTGAINVDGCRVGNGEERETSNGGMAGKTSPIYGTFNRPRGPRENLTTMQGRWPANVAHDGSDEVTAAFPDRDVNTPSSRGTSGDGWGMNAQPEIPSYGDTGSAARFFYTAKADADDRLGSKHPTVKPLDLMQWLVRLVTPRGGVVLDPFSGTGTTGEAAWREGMRAVLIEAEPEYQEDIRRRMRLVLAGPDERARESIKAKNLPVDYGPLFGFPEAAE